METFFPSLSDNAKTKEYYSGLKRRALLVLEGITGEGKPEEVSRIEYELLKLVPPQTYAGHQGAEVQMIKAYERACAVMSQHIAKDPKRMTVLEFYESLEALKAQGKKQYQLNGQPD